MKTNLLHAPEFGKGLLVVRKRLGVSQAQVGKKLGWADGSRISRIESGIVAPSPTVMNRIAKILHVKAEEIARAATLAPTRPAVIPQTSHWKYDETTGIASVDVGGYPFNVDLSSVRGMRGLAPWLRCVVSQSWANDDVVAEFMEIAVRVVRA